MSVEVVTVWAPRPTHPKWRPDYLPLIDLQRKTAFRFGHKHTVVTDSYEAFAGVDRLFCQLPESLMKAMIVGVIARLSMPVESDLVFVDADVLITRDLNKAFDGTFDLGLTRRENQNAPINNGAMYVSREAVQQADAFFRRALTLCLDHWGGDQEAISKAAAPVPSIECVENREGMRLAFLAMRTHSAVPKGAGRMHGKHGVLPFAVHFKGDEAKGWAHEYAERFIFSGDEKSVSAIGS